VALLRERPSHLKSGTRIEILAWIHGIPARRKRSQPPLGCGDHRRTTALRGLDARTVFDRHPVLSRLVDVTDAARVRPRVTQRRMLGRIERAVLRVDACAVVACVVLGHC
jgi:hypothetical protein